MSTSPANAQLIPAHVMLALKQEAAFIKALARKDAERSRKRTRKLIEAMATSTPESRVAAAKARARAVHAQIDDIAAQSDLATALTPSDAALAALTEVRIDDLTTLLGIRDELPVWLLERIKTVHAKINWKTRKGSKGYFNKAVHKNHIPVDKSLTILAHMFNVPDDLELRLHAWVEAVLECGLYPRIRRGKYEYGQRCQDGEHCELCNYLNISDGLKTLFTAYGPRTFRRGGNWFAITVAPRLDPSGAKAVGRTLKPEDWDYENHDSVVFRESRQGLAFPYPGPLDDCEDWEVQSTIRKFLGAVQFTLGKLVKNGWLDGIRARVENSFKFLPYTEHQHWHAVGSSKCEHDPQRMAEFIKEEADTILAQTCPGVYADVVVAVIPTPEDLRHWVKYSNKPFDLVGAVASVYNRHPGLRRTDPAFAKFFQELRAYPQRYRGLLKVRRLQIPGEEGSHTYCLWRRYVRGNHKFKRGSILTESERHRLWRKKHREGAERRRAQQSG